MKQLKFMLAAAAAFGIATAQADTPMKEKKLIDNENFDAVAADTAATTLSGYSYDGATAADNESVVKAGGYNSDNALQVNTGTDPLLRALDYDGQVNSVTLTAEKSVYIDTMVQFTVTPAGDTVTKGDDDKLMIYLAEVTNETGVVTGTNLMVKAGKHVRTQSGRDFIDSFEPLDVAVSASGITVAPNVWYRLKVTSYVVGSITLFTATLDGVDLVAETQMYLLDTENKIFPSMVYGTDDSATLTYVGFAGEGLVDNLTVATLEPQTSVDFTFTWTTAGISAVTYTIGDGTVVKDQPVTSGTAIAELDPGATITIAVTPADWYALVDDAVLSYEVPATTGQSANLDDLVKKLAEVANDGSVTIESTTTPAALNIMTGSFASEAAGSEELAKAVKWATSKGGATASTVGSTVGALNFADSEETQAEKAYLLNVADNAKAVADAIAAFKFDAFDPLDPPEADDFASKGYNGTVTIKGATAVDGVWGNADATSKFFKAVLTK